MEKSNRHTNVINRCSTENNSGHPGMPMGMADVCTVLFGNHLKFDPNDPDWPDRDRFILSAGSWINAFIFNFISYGL